MNVAKCISYDNTDIHFHNMQDSAIIILCVTSMTNVRKSNRNFVVLNFECCKHKFKAKLVLHHGKESKSI